MLIYRIRCVINDKSYVGRSNASSYAVWRYHIHLSDSGDNRTISRALRHYGAQNFQITTVAVCKPLDGLRIHQQYCDMFRSQQDGFNTSETLEVIDPVKKLTETPKRRQAQQKKRGTILSSTVKQKISEGRKGRSIGSANSMNDPNARKKVAESKIGRKKVWLADGTYKYIHPGKCAETALLFNVL